MIHFVGEMNIFYVVLPFHGQELVSDFGEESNGIRSL